VPAFLPSGHGSSVGCRGSGPSRCQPIAAASIDSFAAIIKLKINDRDPGSEAVAVRDREEGIGGTLAAKIRSALTYYRPLADVNGCEVRLHSTTLYASLFRYDDEILVNPHAYGEPASANLTLHLRQIDGGRVADHYLSSFERVWAAAVPWSGGDV